MDSPLFIRELVTLIFTLVDTHSLYLLSLICKDFRYIITLNSSLSYKIEGKGYHNNILTYGLVEKYNNLVLWAINRGFRVTQENLETMYDSQKMMQFELASKNVSNEINVTMLNKLYNKKKVAVRDVYIRVLETHTNMYIIKRIVISMVFYVASTYCLYKICDFCLHMVSGFSYNASVLGSYKNFISGINICVWLFVELLIATKGYCNILLILVVIGSKISRKLNINQNKGYEVLFACYAILLFALIVSIFI